VAAAQRHAHQPLLTAGRYVSFDEPVSVPDLYVLPRDFADRHIAGAAHQNANVTVDAPLNGSIFPLPFDGCDLSAPFVLVVALQALVRHVVEALASERRGAVPQPHGIFARLVKPALDAWIRLEVSVDQLFSLVERYPQARGQPSRAHAVGQTEVDSLG